MNVGSETNSCQKTDRLPASPGHDPCTELEQRAGIWRFSADRLGQRFSDGRRFATGLRNAMGLAVQPGNETLYAAVHGRDQLSDNWGFSNEVNANSPGEELVRVRSGDDLGWPYCYYSNQYKKKVLAPEYGGDGTSVQERPLRRLSRFLESIPASSGRFPGRPRSVRAGRTHR